MVGKKQGSILKTTGIWNDEQFQTKPIVCSSVSVSRFGLAKIDSKQTEKVEKNLQTASDAGVPLPPR